MCSCRCYKLFDGLPRVCDYAMHWWMIGLIPMSALQLWLQHNLDLKITAYQCVATGVNDAKEVKL